MNYLTLAQKLRIKCRIVGTGPTAVTGQNAQYTFLLNCVRDAWTEIQGLHDDWLWMRKSASCVTEQGKPHYGPTDFALTDFRSWATDIANCDVFSNYVTSTGPDSSIDMGVIDYATWNSRYQNGVNTNSRPVEIAITPDNKLCVGPVPKAGYTLVGNYYATQSVLSGATDTPEMPAQYHQAIIYKAMMLYGAVHSQAVYDEGLAAYTPLIAQIERAQLRNAGGPV